MGQLPNSTDFLYDFTNHRGETCKIGWLMDVRNRLGEPIQYTYFLRGKKCICKETHSVDTHIFCLCICIPVHSVVHKRFFCMCGAV
jgi:hypothetical protein